MLKKTPHLMLAGVLALAPAPAALAEYDQVCLNIGAAGYIATFKWALARRDNPNGLEPHWVDSNQEQGDAIARIHAHQSECVNLRDIGAGPGDRLRFYVEAHAGNTVECKTMPRHQATHEGFFLNPDGRRQGVLTFRSSGTSLNHECVLESGDLRMHSECNAALDGMDNAGCGMWRPEIRPAVLHDIVKRDRGIGMLGSALRRGAGVNETERPGDLTPLHHAATLNRAVYAKALVDAGANVGARGTSGETPVISAVAANPEDPAALREILKAPRDQADAAVNSPMDNGDFPLFMAARMNRPDIADMLVDAGARVNAQHSVSGDNALEIAKQMGHREVESYLREQGARERVYPRIVYDIVAEDRGISSLAWALSQGANPNAVGEEGKTALHLAAERGHLHYLGRLLRAADVNPSLRDDQGRTPLVSAIERNNPELTIIRKLLSRGVNVNKPRMDGSFPLYLAVENVRLDIVKELSFVNGLNYNARHPDTNMTAAELADSMARSGHNRRSDFRKIRRYLRQVGGQ